MQGEIIHIMFKLMIQGYQVLVMGHGVMVFQIIDFGILGACETSAIRISPPKTKTKSQTQKLKKCKTEIVHSFNKIHHHHQDTIVHNQFHHFNHGVTDRLTQGVLNC